MNHYEGEIKQCTCVAEHRVGPPATLIITVAAVGRSGAPWGLREPPGRGRREHGHVWASQGRSLKVGSLCGDLLWAFPPGGHLLGCVQSPVDITSRTHAEIWLKAICQQVGKPPHPRADVPQFSVSCWIRADQSSAIHFNEVLPHLP